MNAPLNARKRYDYLIVGAGFAGSILAERLASQHGARVLLIDRRPHIGGNAYDEKNSEGILYHKYGPHIFHTNSEQVVEYLSQFTKWRPYEHRVLAQARGQQAGQFLHVALQHRGAAAVEFILERLDNAGMVVAGVVDTVAGQEIDDAPAVGRS